MQHPLRACSQHGLSLSLLKEASSTGRYFFEVSKFEACNEITWHVMKLEWCLINFQMPLDMLCTIISGRWSGIADIHKDLQETMPAMFRADGGRLEKHVKYLHYDWPHLADDNNIYFSISIAQWLRFLIFSPVIRFYVSLQMCRPTTFVNEKQCWISGRQFAVLFRHHYYWLGYFAKKYCAGNVMTEAICWNGIISRTSKRVFNNSI